MAKPPTDLKEFVGVHIAYEISMLRSTRGYLLSREWDHKVWPDGVIYNALIESYWVHARNLLDFFKADRNSCSPLPFCMSYQKLDFKKELNFNGKQLMVGTLYGQICTQITHLGVDRTAEDSNKLKFTDEAIYEFIEAEIKRFLDHLKDVYKALIPVRVEAPKTINVSGPPSATSTSFAVTGPVFYPAAKKPES